MIKGTAFKSAVTRIHLWAGLILGVQVALWMAGGVVMSWIPIEKVRGEHNVAPKEWLLLNPASDYVPISELLANQERGAFSVGLTVLLDRAVYKVARPGDWLLLADAVTGETLSLLSEDLAVRIAEADFAGDAPVVSVDLIRERTTEYRHETPVWRIRFGDEENTNIYVSPHTGQVRARRNDTWRLFDFFWMLHIMDYGERTNFNNPLLMAFSASGLVFALSGIALVVFRLRARRYANDVRSLTRPRPLSTHP
ncbi:MAG: PepSY domain-containing protein [Xanthomonadales bacterium]|nr:PepSY domain-containing protein [Xanthomonadales bacterium]